MVDLVFLDVWVFLREFLLLVFEVVEFAIMRFGVPMLGAVHVAALAGVLHEAYLLSAVPALVRVRLHKTLVSIRLDISPSRLTSETQNSLTLE